MMTAHPTYDRDVRADHEHQPVEGGLECPDCGATRQTPLGFRRHRDSCPEIRDSLTGASK